MTLQIDLEPEVVARLRREASARGEDISAYAARILREALTPETIRAALAPVREAFERSGMTEDELSALLEREKHAMRAEKRVPSTGGPPHGK